MKLDLNLRNKVTVPSPWKGEGVIIWTIGHSTRTIEDFTYLLHLNEIDQLADIRSLPGSKRYPHFNQEHLSDYLRRHFIHYQWIKELGGRRKPHKNSHNTAWRSKSFQAYADYMETAEFSQGIEKLLSGAKEKRTAIMCSEAVWWKCHRSLVADYLKSIGIEVIHILIEDKNEIHPYTAAAKLKNGKLSYES